MWDLYDEERGRRWQWFWAGAAAGALVVALTWAFWQVGDPTGESRAGDFGVTRSAGQAAGSQTAEERCAQVFTAQRRPLRAGATAMRQWEIHIGAMNQLVAGAITLQQATAFWDGTRVGAARNLERYRAAATAYDGRTAHCPAPGRAGSASGDRPCQKAVAARSRELRLMDRALKTWSTHVDHMEMLRMGEMTPQEATSAWLASWRVGADQVAGYRAAERKAHGLTCSP